jgi:hypothetical protein
MQYVEHFLHECRADAHRYQHLQLPFALVGVESKLFATLAAESRPFNITEISEKTGIHLDLLSAFVYVLLSLEVTRIDYFQNGYYGTTKPRTS